MWTTVTGKQEADYGERVRGTINGGCKEERLYKIRFDDGRLQEDTPERLVEQLKKGEVLGDHL